MGHDRLTIMRETEDGDGYVELTIKIPKGRDREVAKLMEEVADGIGALLPLLQKESS